MLYRNDRGSFRGWKLIKGGCAAVVLESPHPPRVTVCDSEVSPTRVAGGPFLPTMVLLVAGEIRRHCELFSRARQNS
jgi:hypothetical protein